MTKGAGLVTTYLDPKQESDTILQRKFCSRCGTPLYTLGTTLAVFYSALDNYEVNGDAHPKPQIEYYSKDRLPWVKPVEGAQQPKKKPGRD